MSRKKILIVEDDTDLAKALSKRLRANSYDTLNVVDADSAVKMANEEKPDLILLDICLPGEDGFIVKERLDKSADLSSIPIIVITAIDPSNMFERSLKDDVAAFFQKPFNDEQLLNAIKRILGESPDSDEVELSDTKDKESSGDK